MIYSEAARAGARRVVSRYSYDGLGRRTLEREEGGETMRRLYDGLGFEEIRAGATFSDGSFTTRYATGVVRPEAKEEGMRYRWLGETGNGIRGGNATGAATAVKYTGIQAVLYARGEAVGMNLTSSVGSRGGSLYLGKDILGSVRSSSGEYGTLEDRYEYDAFGKPYKGDLDNGMSLGYTGKPYDTTTGLYNYGYRDYKPEAARFTTVDPVRDGSNWFAYVNNDPVNWVDPWGLNANEPEQNGKNGSLFSGTIESPNIYGLANGFAFGEYNISIQSQEGASKFTAEITGISTQYVLANTPIGDFSLHTSGLTASTALGFSDTGSFIPGLENVGIEITASAAYGEINLHYENNSKGLYGGIGLSNGVGFSFKNMDGEIGIDIRALGIHVYAGKK
jgi:RHS repeat-associated protein